MTITHDKMPTKLPKVAFYLTPELKEDLETLAKLDKRSVSNLVYAWVVDNIEQARAEGKLVSDHTEGK